MDTNEYILTYINNIDQRLNSNSYISKLSNQYTEFARYLNLTQQWQITLILNELNDNGIVFKNAISIPNFKYYITQLLAVELIEQIKTPKLPPEMIAYLGEYNAYKMSYYSLTSKGKDFISLDYIKKYLEANK